MHSIQNMKAITLDNKRYYLADEIKKNNPELFIGCQRSLKTIVEKKKIPKNMFLFVTYHEKKKEWATYDDPPKKAKLLIRKKWFLGNSNKESIKVAPEEIDLKESEKFRDKDGNTIEVEVRGDRDPDKCFFKAMDIAEGFGIKRLTSALLNRKEKSKFIEGNHYRYLSGSINDAKPRLKTLFLTFKGVLKVLFCSRK